MTACLVLGDLVANRPRDPSASQVQAARSQIGRLLGQGGQNADPGTWAALAEE
jgi:hypothetical protein